MNSNRLILVEGYSLLRCAGVAFLVIALQSQLLGCSSRSAGIATIDYTGNIAEDFVKAVEFGDAPKVEELLKADTSLLGLQDILGQTPLHYAVLNNRPEVVQSLIKHGMDPNIRDANGNTALTVLEDSGIRAFEARDALRSLGGTN